MSSLSASRGAVPPPETAGTAPRLRLRRLVWGAVCIAASFWFWQWISTDETGAPVAQTSDEPSSEAEGVKGFLVRSRDGKPLWQLNANRVSSSADGQTTTATKVGPAILYRAGKPFLELSAPVVRVSTLSNNLSASGGISASGPNQFSFQTSSAMWIDRLKSVECPKPVSARLHDLWFETPRLSYQWDKGVLMCPQPVEVRATGAVLRGQRLEADLNTRQIRLGGGVEMIFSSQLAKLPTPHK